MTLHELFASPIVDRLGWTLLHSTWQGAAIAAMLAIASGLLARRSAQARYLAACVAMTAMLAVGAVTFFVVRPPLDPVATPARVEESSQTPAAKDLPRGRSDAARGISSPPSVSSLGQLEGQVEKHDVAKPTPAMPAAGVPPDAGGPAAPAPALARTGPQPARFAQLAQPCLPWLVAAWLLGVGVLGLWRVGGLIAAWRLTTIGTQPAAKNIEELAVRLANRLGVRRMVQIVQSLVVDTPMVIGWLRPVILLPLSSVTGLSGPQLEAILAHELAHIRRHDYLLNLLQGVVETLLFYHPAVWWMSRLLRAERERCCDDVAVQLCGDRIGYAEALAAVEATRAAWTARLPVAAVTAGSPGGKDFVDRVGRILGIRDHARNPLVPTRLAALTAAVSVMAFVSVSVLAKSSAPDPAVRQRLQRAIEVTRQLAAKGQRIDADIVPLQSDPWENTLGKKYTVPRVEDVAAYRRAQPWASAYRPAPHLLRPMRSELDDTQDWPAESDAVELRKLLNDKDPAMRCMAVEALATLHQPEDVPRIGRLVTDKAGGLPTLGWNILSPRYVQEEDVVAGGLDRMRSWHDCTVAATVRRALKLMTGEDLDTNVDAWWQNNRGGRDRVWYWRQRLTRELQAAEARSLSELLMLGNGQSDTKEYEAERVRIVARYKHQQDAVRQGVAKELEQLPAEIEAKLRLLAVNRIIYSLGFGVPVDTLGVPIDKQLMGPFHCPRITSDRLLELLEHRNTGGDPDWRQPIHYPVLVAVVLGRAEEFFTREQVPRLRAIVQREYGRLGINDWDAKVASLVGLSHLLPAAPADNLDDPHTRDGWLRSRMRSERDVVVRGCLAEELIRVGLPENWEFLKQQFFAEMAREDSTDPKNVRMSILWALGDPPLSAAKRAALLGIVLDERFDLWTSTGLHQTYLDKTIRAVNAHAGRVLITEADRTALMADFVPGMPAKALPEVLRKVETLKQAPDKPANEQRNPLASTSADKSDDAGWGQAADGASVRLRAERTRWTTRETPTFTLDIRNRGHRNFRVFQSPVAGAFVVDGNPFGWTLGWVGGASSPLPPGRSYEGLRACLDDGWKPTPRNQTYQGLPVPADENWPAKHFRDGRLTPGKYTIQFVSTLYDANVWGKAIRRRIGRDNPIVTCISNPVEIEIVASDAAPAPAVVAWGNAVEGVAVSLKTDHFAWTTDEPPTFKASVRNLGQRNLSVAQAQQLGELEMDGIWHRWAGAFDVMSSAFPPDRQYDNIQIVLGSHWRTQDRQLFHLAEGRHVVRFAANAGPWDSGGKPVRAVSNPVEINVEPGISEPAGLVKKCLPGCSLRSVRTGTGDRESFNEMLTTPSGKSVDLSSLRQAWTGDPSGDYYRNEKLIPLLRSLKVKITTRQEAENAGRVMLGISRDWLEPKEWSFKAERRENGWLVTPSYIGPTAQVRAQEPIELIVAEGVLHDVRLRSHNRRMPVPAVP